MKLPFIIILIQVRFFVQDAKQDVCLLPWWRLHLHSFHTLNSSLEAPSYGRGQFEKTGFHWTVFALLALRRVRLKTVVLNLGQWHSCFLCFVFLLILMWILSVSWNPIKVLIHSLGTKSWSWPCFMWQNQTEGLCLGACSCARAVPRIRLWSSAYLCLYAAGCCCSGWAAWGLWTAGTAWAWDGGCCSWTDPSSRCQTAGWMGRCSKLEKDKRHKKTSVVGDNALQRCKARKIKFYRCTVRDSWSQKPEWYSPGSSEGLEIQSVCIRTGFQDAVWVVCNFEPSQVWQHA